MFLSPCCCDLPLPVLGRLEHDELAEGGDTVWLDERTLLVGHTYRTNAAGIEALSNGTRMIFRSSVSGGKERRKACSPS